MMKMIPYGLTDFVAVRTENYYYVDKTSFIEKIEMQPRYLFLIRPRRFGKSMTLAMLETYYDIRYAPRFDEIFRIETYRLEELMMDMALTANWKPLFEYLADAIRRQSRIREYIEGEAHIKGFLLAYLGMFRYYELYPEYELNKGFADFFFKPNRAVPVAPPYTFLLEVKYCKAGATDAEVQTLAHEAREQLLKYAHDELVAEARGKEKLKLITVVWRSWELVLLEEVEY